MDNSTALQQSVIKEVASLFGNDEAMKKLLSLARKLKRDSKANANEASEELTAAEKKEVMDDIRDGLCEIKMAKEGKTELQTWESFKHELHC